MADAEEVTVVILEFWDMLMRRKPGMWRRAKYFF